MIRSPLLIIGCARSGTTLLYHLLSEIDELWSLGYESKGIVERYHSPAHKDWASGALTAADLTPESRRTMLQQFAAQAAPGNYWRAVHHLSARANRSGLYQTIKRRGRGEGVGAAAGNALPGGGLGVFRGLARLRNVLAPPNGTIRLLEKTPENCLRLPFLQALFPDARILFLTRDGRANTYSLLEGWRQPHTFPGYRPPLPVTAPGQTRGRWAFTLIPGWRELVARPLEEICARQWAVCNTAVLDYAAGADTLPLLKVAYEDLVRQPDEALSRIATFIGVRPEDIPAFGRPLPEVNAVSRPEAEKWRREADLIARVEGILEPVMARLGYSIEE